jgi:hypothetical protein
VAKTFSIVVTIPCEVAGGQVVDVVMPAIQQAAGSAHEAELLALPVEQAEGEEVPTHTEVIAAFGAQHPDRVLCWIWYSEARGGVRQKGVG